MSHDELDEGWGEDASVLDASDPRLAELDDGWGDSGDDDAPASAGAARGVKRRRAPREVRAQRQREAEEKRQAARAKKQAEIDAKRKRKQPKAPSERAASASEKASKREAKAARRARTEDAPTVYGGAGAPDLAREVPHRKFVQNAHGAPTSRGVPPWVGYLVLALLVGGAALYLILQR